jgi:hypothetical protein
MVHRNSILLPLATLALIGGVNAQEESRTRRGLGATNVEYVSDEPLTFETPELEEEVLVDRDSLLAIEPEDEGGFDNEVMDGDFENYYKIMDGEDEGEEYEGEWLPMEEGEEVVGDFDSTYSSASEDGLDFFTQDEGFVHTPKKVYAPIARRLRRLGNPVEVVEELAEEMDEERSLAEKENLFREEYDSIPIVSLSVIIISSVLGWNLLSSIHSPLPPPSPITTV